MLANAPPSMLADGRSRPDKPRGTLPSIMSYVRLVPVVSWGAPALLLSSLGHCVAATPPGMGERTTSVKREAQPWPHAGQAASRDVSLGSPAVRLCKHYSLQRVPENRAVLFLQMSKFGGLTVGRDPFSFPPREPSPALAEGAGVLPPSNASPPSGAKSPSS